MKLTIFVAIGAATMGGGCRNSGTDSPSGVPGHVQGGDNDLDTSGGNVVRCSPLEGGAMSSLVDDTWVTVDPGHELIPVQFKMPKGIKGKLIEFTNTDALYLVELTDTRPGLGAVLQFGGDGIRSPGDFAADIRRSGGAIETQVRSAVLGGRAATEECGSIKMSLPHAVIQDESGAVRTIPEREENDRYYGIFVTVGGRVFRASYRLPDAEAAEWEPVFKAILSTVTWKE